MYNYSMYQPHRHVAIRPARSAPFDVRAKRLRMIWFTLGMLCGAVMAVSSYYLASALSTSEQAPTQISPDPSGVAPVSSRSSTKPTPPQEIPITWPRSVKVTVGSGHVLSSILTRHGISADDAYVITEALKKRFDPRDLKAGDKLLLELDKDRSRPERLAATLKNMQLAVSPIESIRVERNATGDYASQRIAKKIHKEVARTSGTIGKQFDGIYKVAKSQGTPDDIIFSLIKAYSYDVDFQRDIKRGDSIDILYEKHVTEDKHTVRGGKILYAALHTRGKRMPIYYFSDGDNSGFFNERGESIIKKLLRTPIDGARISSGFGMRRHPILGYSKMHKGVDFAAPTGTPIFAAGDGRIVYAGVKGGYGNYVAVKHNSSFTTAYGHASRIARGITVGKSVKQGDVIAYVGTTGRSTGPHLHYEIMKDGDQVNPSKVKFAGNDKLTGKQLASFRAFKSDVAKHLASLPAGGETKLAQRDSVKSNKTQR